MVSLDIQVITTSGNNYDIQLKDEDKDMIEYLIDEKKELYSYYFTSNKQ